MWNSPSSSPWHKLRSENWQVFLQGRLRLGFSRKRLNTIKAASPSGLPRTQASVFSSNSSWTTPETLISYNIFYGHRSAARLLQGTGRILLDELLVAGIADGLRVNTGRERQLICWTGLAEDTTTVLADILKQKEKRKIQGCLRHLRFFSLTFSQIKSSTGLEKDAQNCTLAPSKDQKLFLCLQHQRRAGEDI